jgi:hypothetical protein
MNPNQAYYSSNNSRPNRGRRMLYIFGGIFLALLLIIAVVLSMTSKKDTAGTSSSKDNDSSGETLSLSYIANPTFVSPKDMKGYVKGNNIVDNVYDYTTVNNACSLQFGVAGASDLPGLTIEEIAATNLGTTADTGAVADDPVEKGNLVLHNNKTTDKYTLPTIEIAFSRNGVNYLSRFSLATIKGNGRAYVRTYCSNDGGVVSSSEFKKINDKAKQVMISTEQ